MSIFSWIGDKIKDYGGMAVGTLVGGPFGALAGNLVGSALNGGSGSQQASGGGYYAPSPSPTITRPDPINWLDPAANTGGVRDILNVNEAMQPMSYLMQTLANQKGGMANGAQLGGIGGGFLGTSQGLPGGTSGASAASGGVSPMAVASMSPQATQQKAMSTGYVPKSMAGYLNFNGGQYHQYVPQIGVGDPSTSGQWKALGIGYVPPEVTQAWNAEQGGQMGTMGVQSVAPSIISPFGGTMTDWNPNWKQNSAADQLARRRTAVDTPPATSGVVVGAPPATITPATPTPAQTQQSTISDILTRMLAGQGGLSETQQAEALNSGLGTIAAQRAGGVNSLSELLANRGLSHSGIAQSGLTGLYARSLGQAGTLASGLAAQEEQAARDAQRYGMQYNLSERQMAAEAQRQAEQLKLSQQQFALQQLVAKNQISQQPGDADYLKSLLGAILVNKFQPKTVGTGGQIDPYADYYGTVYPDGTFRLPGE